MTDLDTVLMRLAAAPLPASLEFIDERVFSGVAAVRTRHVARGLGVMSIGAALVMGVAGAAMSPRETGVTSLAPLGPVPALSPAALLGAEQ